MTDSIQTLPLKSINGFASGLSISRKRSRDSSSFNPSLISIPNVSLNYQHQNGQFGELTLLNDDISSQMYQQQLEIDRFVVHHTENVRTEIEEMRRQNARRLIAAVHEGITKRLKTKEEEIIKIGQMNWSLEEKVKSLIVENQILKELCETNEATANALRNKLQQVLAQIQLPHHEFADNSAKAKATSALVDDAESFCGSNYEEDHERDRERKVSDRWCRSCGKEESCVLLLPCRHLCVCTSCVSSLNICPICNSVKSAAVVVNMNLF
ncbi:hypothetical protein QVD17_13983 [Tagetes erecta]|uniref:RING-type domain-containing protein n=1 Tax=Tagetes erecta TaxID=13708 RepID=A0AAD8L2T6_TARER|nr:hypothetical protein QVD17_13983 [Tagetes erecta]